MQPWLTVTGQECQTPDGVPWMGATVSSLQYQEFACEAGVLCSTEPCELDSPNPVSGRFSPDERVGGASRATPSAPSTCAFLGP